MPVYFHKLENALKRANEFIDVGKRARALEILCDVLRSRKHRQWQKKHEDIMMKYLELCVDLRKSFVAKEGIYQYKIICQQMYIKSFEDVVRRYLELAEERTEKARASAAVKSVDVDDLEVIETPESILLSAVSAEDTQDRKDRVVLLPWVKFLWESYRQCLDLLKNNARTERLYHDIAHQAFRFCIKYSRKTEFRKLCDHLHAHLDLLKKQQLNVYLSQHAAQNIVNLSNPESQAMHLETRLVQLEHAIQMELWQEAYRATDDIKRYGLMNLSKKPLKPQLMADYYRKLSLVFWKANCHLFHAAALFRLLNLSKELRKNITYEDVQKMASRVVLATLSIPIAPNRLDIDKLVDTEENVIENHQRNLASLLGLTQTVPTRKTLINDLRRMGILPYAYEPLQELYRILEIDFNPLNLCSRVEKVIAFVEKCEEVPDMQQYINALKDVTIMRLLKEVSQVYQFIEYDRLRKLCPFAKDDYLEKMIVEAARRYNLQVRIDHRNKTLSFGAELNLAQGEEVVEGPHIQGMPSEQIRLQLVTMYTTLEKAQQAIDAEQIAQNRNNLLKNIMATYQRFAQKEHEAMLERQTLIEMRKEELEHLTLRREEEERKKQMEKEFQLRQAEEERIRKETEEREKQMRKRHEYEIKTKINKEQIQRMRELQGGAGIIDTLKDEELARFTPGDIQMMRIKQLEKERVEQLNKQRKLERKFDHVERAKRIEELPLLERKLQKWKEQDKKFWEQQEQERIKALILQREEDIKQRDRLKRMLDEKNKFEEMIKKARYSVYQEKLKAFNERLAAAKIERMEERKRERKAERQKKWQIEQETKRAQALAEERRRQKEEEERKFAEIMEKQRKKEEEIEAKMREREQELMKQREEQMKAEGASKDEGLWRKQRPVSPLRDSTDPRREERGPIRGEPDRDRRPPFRGGERGAPPYGGRGSTGPREREPDVDARPWRQPKAQDEPRGPEDDRPQQRRPYVGRGSDGPARSQADNASSWRTSRPQEPQEPQDTAPPAAARRQGPSGPGRFADLGDGGRQEQPGPRRFEALGDGGRSREPRDRDFARDTDRPPRRDFGDRERAAQPPTRTREPEEAGAWRQRPQRQEEQPAARQRPPQDEGGSWRQPKEQTRDRRDMAFGGDRGRGFPPKEEPEKKSSRFDALKDDKPGPRRFDALKDDKSGPRRDFRERPKDRGGDPDQGEWRTVGKNK